MQKTKKLQLCKETVATLTLKVATGGTESVGLTLCCEDPALKAERVQ